jgi:hypothetical protein
MTRYGNTFKPTEAGRSGSRLARLRPCLDFRQTILFWLARKEAAEYGYQAGKISLKERHITFQKLED